MKKMVKSVSVVFALAGIGITGCSIPGLTGPNLGGCYNWRTYNGHYIAKFVEFKSAGGNVYKANAGEVVTLTVEGGKVVTLQREGRTPTPGVLSGDSILFDSVQEKLEKVTCGGSK